MAEATDHTIISTVRDYSGRLFNFIRGYVKSNEDAEDILQDVWYQFTNTLSTQTIEEVSGWLFAVARNKITDRYRKKKNETVDYDDDENVVSMEIKEILFSDSADHEMSELKKLFWEELIAALEELPEKQREVYVCNELEDMTLQEIADKSGENIKTIISRKRYAVQHLRTRLKDLYTEILNY